jgi:hypothetical protein
MKALIDPTASVYHIASWYQPEPGKPYEPVYEAYPFSARVCQVEPDAQIFPVAEPLFWESCPDNVLPDVFWFNTVTTEFSPVENAPNPATQGLQTV